MDEYWQKEAVITDGLPEGYFIIDGEVQQHDCDEEDGRYCAYSPDEEPLGNLHNLEDLIALTHQHAAGR